MINDWIAMAKSSESRYGGRRQVRRCCLVAVIVCLLITASVTPAQTILPGTEALTFDGDPATRMVDAIHDFLLHETAVSIHRREQLWHRDYRSPEAFERSISPNRETFRTIQQLKKVHSSPWKRPAGTRT